MNNNTPGKFLMNLKCSEYYTLFLKKFHLCPPLKRDLIQPHFLHLTLLTFSPRPPLTFMSFLFCCSFCFVYIIKQAHLVLPAWA